MRKLAKLLSALLALSMLLSVAALAAEDPSVDIALTAEGETVRTASVGLAAADDVYTIDLGELLDAFGLSMTYDETNAVVTVTARPGTVGEALFAQLAQEAADDEPSLDFPEPIAWSAEELAEEPLAEEAPAEAGEELPADWWAFPQPVEESEQSAPAPGAEELPADWWAFPQPVE